MRTDEGSSVHAAANVDAESLWSRFARADDLHRLCQSWLALQCQALPGAQIAAVLWREADGTFAAVAAWPGVSAGTGQLGQAARKALAERRGFSMQLDAVPAQPPQHIVAYPVIVDDEPAGVVVIQLSGLDTARLQLAMQSLHWGAGWLEKLARDQLLPVLVSRCRGLEDANDLLAVVLEQHDAHAAAIALCNEIATATGATRVTLGFTRGDRIEVEAISHTAWFDRRSVAIGALENLMEEALDQESAVVAPLSAGDPFCINVAHDEFRRSTGMSVVLSVPLPGRETQIGVMTLEFAADASPAPEMRGWIEATALLVGPALEDKLMLRRWVAGRAADLVRGLWRRLTVKGYASWKAGATVLVILLAGVTLIRQDYRVTADAVIEGAVQRALVAPFRGYVREAPVRAGATVQRGDVLAVLDDRDLVLEKVRWTAERDQALQKQRDALARRERANAVQFEAQVQQAQAQLELVEEKLQRSRITAPIDGLVVSGDLSQMLGSPVEVGDTLFEIAPLDEYRVILQVDERDMNDVSLGQRGRVILAGLARSELDFTISNVTAVTEAKDGSNVFRVEARLASAAEGLRPGMEGVGKIDAGRRSILWVWVHPISDWFRLALWRWLP